MVAARANLVMGQPFFGALAMRLDIVEDPTCKTAWTDGVHMGYNPEFVAGLTIHQREGLFCHEVMHCSNGHPWRRSGRQGKRWNIACDAAINPLILDAKMQLPTNGVDGSPYLGQSAEYIYSQLPENDGNGGSGDGDPGGCGEVRDCPSEGTDGEGIEPSQVEAEWQVATIQAATQAKQQGKLPAGLERLLGTIRQPGCRDLVSALREFVGQSAKEDYSYRRPSSRHIAMGLYLPTLYSEALPPVVAAVDTSGSIDAKVLCEFVGALQVVLDECRPSNLHVMSCDAEVHGKRADYAPGDMISANVKDYPGGGGTDFRPVFNAIGKMDDAPCCAVYLTDGLGTYGTAPDYPVLWVMLDHAGRRSLAPFGETVWID